MLSLVGQFSGEMTRLKIYDFKNCDIYFVMDVEEIRLSNILWGTETITSMNEFYQGNDVDSLSSNKELTVFLKESCLNTAVGHSGQ